MQPSGSHGCMIFCSLASSRNLTVTTLEERFCSWLSRCIPLQSAGFRFACSIITSGCTFSPDSACLLTTALAVLYPSSSASSDGASIYGCIWAALQVSTMLPWCPAHDDSNCHVCLAAKTVQLTSQLAWAAQMMEADVKAWNERKAPAQKSQYLFVDGPEGTEVQRYPCSSSLHSVREFLYLNYSEQVALSRAANAMQLTISYELRTLRCRAYHIVSLSFRWFLRSIWQRLARACPPWVPWGMLACACMQQANVK